MATLDALQDSVAKLQDSLSEIYALTERLAHVHDDDADADTDTDDDDDDDGTTADLVADIADGLHDAEDEYELLLEDAADLALPVTKTPAAATADAAAAAAADRARIQDGLARAAKDIQRLHAAFRAARLRARNARDAARRIRHQRLLATYAAAAASDVESDGEEAEEEEQDPVEAPDEEASARRHTNRVRHHHHHHPHHHQHASPPAARSKAASAAADVTTALRQTHARIAGEVARSDFAAQTLAESSRALEELGHRYTSGSASSTSSSSSSVRGSLVAARGLVRGLVAAHKSDTWYLQTALLLVASTIVWLLFRRLLYGPLWLLVWWPLRTTAGGVAGVASAVGWLGSGRGSGSAATTSLLAVTTTATSPMAVVQATPASGCSAGGNSHIPADSMVEQVGQIVDGGTGSSSGSGDGNTAAGAAAADTQEDRPNPMKRMWQEDVEAAKHEAQQDRERQEKEEQQRKKDEL